MRSRDNFTDDVIKDDFHKTLKSLVITSCQLQLNGPFLHQNVGVFFTSNPSSKRVSIEDFKISQNQQCDHIQRYFDSAPLYQNLSLKAAGTFWYVELHVYSEEVDKLKF